MSILIITALDINKSDRKIDTIMKWITDGIKAAGKTYRHIEINELALKRCPRDKCTEREYNLEFPFACAKSKECIVDHNMSVTSAVYDEMILAEAIIYLIGKEHRALWIFFDELYKKEIAYSKKNRGRRRFRDKKYMAIIYSEKDKRSSEREYYELIIGRNRHCLSMEAADCFLVDGDNKLYMEQVIPSAVTAFVTTYVTLHNNSYEWFEYRYGSLL